MAVTKKTNPRTTKGKVQEKDKKVEDLQAEVELLLSSLEQATSALNACKAAIDKLSAENSEIKELWDKECGRGFWEVLLDRLSRPFVWR